MSDLKIVEYPGVSVQDIPRMLREIANEIESGELERPTQILCVRYIEGADGSSVDLHVLGGDIRTAMLVGVLEMAKDYVLRPE